MSDKKDFEIFSGKSLSGLFEDIYTNSSKTKNQVLSLITELKKFITSPENATVMVPLIAQYLEIGVKNDEHLVRLADIVQKLLRADKSNDGSTGEFALTESEREQLLNEATNIATNFRSSAEKDEEKLNELKDQTKILTDKKE
jgi:hypothetical protein